MILYDFMRFKLFCICSTHTLCTILIIVIIIKLLREFSVRDFVCQSSPPTEQFFFATVITGLYLITVSQRILR